MSLQVIREGFAPELVDYLQGWQRQREVHAEVVAGERDDTVLLLEHAAVYTAGKRTEPHERPFDGTPVEMLMRKQEEDAPPLAMRGPIVDLCRELLGRNADNRPTAAAMFHWPEPGHWQRPMCCIRTGHARTTMAMRPRAC